MQDRSPRRRVAASAGLAALALAAACVPDWGNPPPTTTTTTTSTSTTTSTTTTTIPDPVDPTFLGRYATGLGITSAETVAFDDGKMFVTNTSGGGSLDIVDMSNPAAPAFLERVPLGALPNSVDAKDGLVAVAVEAATKTDPGTVVLMETNGDVLTTAAVGALPDMLTFTPDGQKVLVANEGEPASNYSVDPEGTVSVVDVSAVRGGGAAAVTSIGFADFNVGGPRHGELGAGVRVFGPGATVAQDLEPEYITVDATGAKAFVTLQENNALARIDLATNTVDFVRSLGTKDFNLPGAGLDPSDQDGGINIANWPVKGLYMPDAIASFTVAGETYTISANEGDARDYSAYAEERRVGNSGYVLDPVVFPNAAALKANTALGRLNATRASGNLDTDAEFEEIHVFGSRSFTVWDDQGALVSDSGDQLEQLVATTFPANFNANNEDNAADTRSDNKGPEPEGVATAVVDGRPMAYVGLERQGGVVVVDLSDPASPEIVDYLTTRDLTASPVGPDSGPEVLKVVPAADNATGRPLLLVAHEITGTVAVFQL